MSKLEIEPGPEMPFSDRTFYVSFAGRRLLHIGYRVLNMLTREVYVWIIPAEISARGMAECLRAWRHYSRAWTRVYISIDTSDVVAKRFAEFFGFKPMGLFEEGLEIYVRVSDNTSRN